MKKIATLAIVAVALISLCGRSLGAEWVKVTENRRKITIITAQLEASINKTGYVSGVAGGSFLDKKTGFRDLGYGLDIVDWIMEPGSDEDYRDELPNELIYSFNNPLHGKRPKRSIEGPQICTKARKLSPRITQGENFVAVQMSYNFPQAAPKKRAGSRWTQTIVFPAGKRYFISSDRIDTVNASEAMFLRIDMPGHIKHSKGDSFSEVYLSYKGRISFNKFLANFAPDEKYNYRRDDYVKQNSAEPKRFIRAYRIRDPKSGRDGPWLAGMTLDPSDVHEAWCHQRRYICMIEEIGGRPVRPRDSFSAAFIVGFFDSIEEMHQVYDRYSGYSGLVVNKEGWRLTR